MGNLFCQGPSCDKTNDILEQLDFHPLSITLLATIAQYTQWDTNQLTTDSNLTLGASSGSLFPPATTSLTEVPTRWARNDPSRPRPLPNPFSPSYSPAPSTESPTGEKEMADWTNPSMLFGEHFPLADVDTRYISMPASTSFEGHS